MTWRTRLLCATLASAIVTAGCGDSDSPSAEEGTATVSAQATVPASRQELSPAGLRVIETARNEVSAYCRSVAEGLGGGEGPRPSDLDRVTAALDRLAALATEQPGAETVDGTTPRLALGDIAENLEGTNCDPRLVTRIDEALAALPAE